MCSREVEELDLLDHIGRHFGFINNKWVDNLMPWPMLCIYHTSIKPFNGVDMFYDHFIMILPPMDLFWNFL